jgi:hypothetical protein
MLAAAAQAFPELSPDRLSVPPVPRTATDPADEPNPQQGRSRPDEADRWQQAAPQPPTPQSAPQPAPQSAPWQQAPARPQASPPRRTGRIDEEEPPEDVFQQKGW